MKDANAPSELDKDIWEVDPCSLSIVDNDGERLEICLHYYDKDPKAIVSLIRNSPAMYESINMSNQALKDLVERFQRLEVLYFKAMKEDLPENDTLEVKMAIAQIQDNTQLLAKARGEAI